MSEQLHNTITNTTMSEQLHNTIEKSYNEANGHI